MKQIYIIYILFTWRVYVYCHVYIITYMYTNVYNASTSTVYVCDIHAYYIILLCSISYVLFVCCALYNNPTARSCSVRPSRTYDKHARSHHIYKFLVVSSVNKAKPSCLAAGVSVLKYIYAKQESQYLSSLAMMLACMY